MIKHFNGVPVLIPNTITTDKPDEQYYVSYNPSRRDYGVPTTALVITIGNNERQLFYILSGNHAADYEACENLAACLRYFVAHKDQMHEHSDPFEHGELTE